MCHCLGDIRHSLERARREDTRRIDSIWAHFFIPGDINKYDADGEKCVYYEVGNSMGIIVDTGSNDICWSGRSKPSFIL